MSVSIPFDEASLRSDDETPGETLCRSTDIGWSSLLLTLSRCGAADEVFETRPTSDLRICIVMRGELDLVVLRNGVWRHTSLRPGSALLILGGHTLRMRIISKIRAASPEVLNLFLPDRMVAAAAQRCGSGRRRDDQWGFEPLSFCDPAVAAVGSALLTAMDQGAPDAYAETAAQWLATHLACTDGSWSVANRPAFTDPNVTRAIEYMSARLAEPLTLDTLAREAGVSKFHFSRRFKMRTGTTPVAHLLGLRLEAGRRMLATTEDPIGRIAHAVGYERGSHFATAFARRYGETPTDFRRRLRR